MELRQDGVADRRGDRRSRGDVSLQSVCVPVRLEKWSSPLPYRCHVCNFGAKFHCECSAIELLWGRGKHNLRSICDFPLEGLRCNSRQAFLDVPLLTICRFFRKSRDYMRAYREGHPTLSAEEHIKIHKSHRRPVPSEFLRY